MEASGNYHLGKAEGKVQWFYPNGDLKEEYFYSNGELNGIVTKYYPGGRIRIKTEYRNGKRIGARFRYFRDGHLSELACHDSDGNLFYLTQWNAGHNRIMQAFMPVFTIDTTNDSTRIVIKSLIETDGNTELSIGLWDKISEIVPLVKLKLSNKQKVATIPKNVDPDNLFYKIRFEATGTDTINGFEYIKKVIANDTVSEDHKRIDAISLNHR